MQTGSDAGMGDGSAEAEEKGLTWWLTEGAKKGNRE